MKSTGTQDTFNRTEGSAEGVSVITCTNRPNYIDNIFANYSCQLHRPTELILLLNNNSFDIEKIRARAGYDPAITVHQVDESLSLGTCYNLGAFFSKHNYIAKFDDDDYYGPHHLTDTMRAFVYTDADIIGKHSRFIYFESQSVLMEYHGVEYGYTPYVIGATMVFKKSVWEAVKFRSITVGEDSTFQSDCIRKGFKIFAIDKYNYVTVRRRDTSSHTFQLEDDDYMKHCSPVAYTDSYLPLVMR